MACRSPPALIAVRTSGLDVRAAQQRLEQRHARCIIGLHDAAGRQGPPCPHPNRPSRDGRYLRRAPAERLGPESRPCGFESVGLAIDTIQFQKVINRHVVILSIDQEQSGIVPVRRPNCSQRSLISWPTQEGPQRAAAKPSISSSWKCGRRNATARNAPAFPALPSPRSAPRAAASPPSPPAMHCRPAIT